MTGPADGRTYLERIGDADDEAEEKGRAVMRMSTVRIPIGPNGFTVGAVAAEVRKCSGWTEEQHAAPPCLQLPTIIHELYGKAEVHVDFCDTNYPHYVLHGVVDAHEQDSRQEEWIDRELAGCQFRDERLGKRFRKLLEQLSDGAGDSIPTACKDWANTKAAYRFW